MKKVFLLTLVSILLGHSLCGQENKYPKYPLPSDLSGVDRSGCMIVQHGVAEIYNAKTGGTETLFNYRAEPFVVYKDHRTWALPKEVMVHSNTERPGALVDAKTSGEAVDVCAEWTRQLNHALIEIQLEQLKEKKQ